MSPPTAPPSLAAAIGTVFLLQWRLLIRTRKVLLAGAAMGLVLVAVTLTRYLVDEADPIKAMEHGVNYGFFYLLVFLVPFVMCSGAIAEELESRTFTFLSSRPVPRLAITLGKYLAGVAMSLALLVGGLLLLHVAVFVTDVAPVIDELPSTLRIAGAMSLLTFYYGAICVLWGALVPEAAGIVSAVHLALLEFGFGKLPFMLPVVSMNYLAMQLGGLAPTGLAPDTMQVVEAPIAVAVIAFLALVSVVTAALVVSASEYRFGKA